MRRALIASLTVVGWAAVALAAGALLPIQAALAVAVAVSLGVPGWALLRVAGIPERLDTIADRLAAIERHVGLGGGRGQAGAGPGGAAPGRAEAAPAAEEEPGGGEAAGGE